MLAANVAILRLLLCLVIVRNAVVCSNSSDHPIQTVIQEVMKLPLVLDSETSVSSKDSKIQERTTVLRREEQGTRVNATLLKKISEEIEEDDVTSESSKDSRIPNSTIVLQRSPVNATLLRKIIEEIGEGDAISESSKEPRILERKTVTKREKQQSNLGNATLLKKITEEIEEDDTRPSATTLFPGPLLPESSSATKTSMEFRPSVHIGEIHDFESRKSSTSPFNKVHHVKFENSVSIDDPDTGRVPISSSSSSSFHGDGRATPLAGRKRNRVKFFETNSRYGVPVPVEYYVPQQIHQQQQIEEAVATEDDNNDHDSHNQFVPMQMGQEGVVTFEYPRTQYAEVTARPVTLARPAYPATITDHQQMHLQQYEPGVNSVRTIYINPSKFHSEVVTPMPAVHIQHFEYMAPVHGEAMENQPAPQRHQGSYQLVKPSKFHSDLATPMPAVHIQHYEYVTPVGGEAMEKPDAPRHHQGSYQVVPHTSDTVSIGKPETVMFVSSHRETAFSRMRKFPYKFYHPDSVHQDNEYYYVPEEHHAYPPKERRISPWKKIIHLIGAFLPLGLLLATLKPNLVQLDTQNMTQPNIVLSKLRDLPAEHKRGRLESELDNVQEDTCEDKAICEVIVSGSEPDANLLQNILWNLTNKSTDEEAKKHGLDEIFTAVKRKDCSSIDC